MSQGPHGVLECFSHEILEKVAVCLDLDNLKKLSKVSTSFRALATSVSLDYHLCVCDLQIFTVFACRHLSGTPNALN